MELAEISGFFSFGLAQPVGCRGSWATCIHGPSGEALGGPRGAESHVLLWDVYPGWSRVSPICLL